MKWRREPPTEQECLQYNYWWFRGRVTAESAGYGDVRGTEISPMVAGVRWKDGVVRLEAGDWFLDSTDATGEWAPCEPPAEPVQTEVELFWAQADETKPTALTSRRRRRRR